MTQKYALKLAQNV